MVDAGVGKGPQSPHPLLHPRGFLSNLFQCLPTLCEKIFLPKVPFLAISARFKAPGNGDNAAGHKGSQLRAMKDNQAFALVPTARTANPASNPGMDGHGGGESKRNGEKNKYISTEQSAGFEGHLCQKVVNKVSN